MARNEQDREDLLREATALIDRGEFICQRHNQPVIIGFRREGAASFFFSQQHVLHFNSHGELRRAYWEGSLYKSENQRLIRLTRRRTTESVELRRHDLTDAESKMLLATMRGELVAFQAELTAGECRLTEHVGDANLASRVQLWLAEFTGELRLAKSPRVS